MGFGCLILLLFCRSALVVVAVAQPAAVGMDEMDGLFLCRAAHYGGLATHFGLQSRRTGCMLEEQRVPAMPDFYQRYVRPQRPVVLRGAVVQAAARQRWTDAYLHANYGNLTVLIEPKRENRKYGPRRALLSEFLARYEKESVYAVTLLPTPMMAEVPGLPCYLCGSFRQTLQETDFWMSSGGTVSMLHYDADNNINCLLAGHKEFIFVHPRYHAQLDPNIPSGTPTLAGADFSLIDVHRVHPRHGGQLLEVEQQRALLQPGDCVFLPSGHWHQVRSYGRNIAVSVMFLREQEAPFNDADCEPPPPANLSLMDLDFIWAYNGSGLVPMGYPNPSELKQNLLRTLDTQQVDGCVPTATFNEFLYDMLSEAGRTAYLSELQQALGISDAQPCISRSKFEALTRDELKHIAMLVEQPHDSVDTRP